jgi:hypothetical protein
LKTALVEFEATETLAGIAMLPVEVSATVAAAAGGLLSVTVQTATAPGPSVDGLQEMPLSSEVAVVVAVPPVPLIVSAPPPADAPTPPEIPTVAEVAVAARVIDTVATVPLAIRLVLLPLTTQMALPEELVQFNFFAAAVRAGPAATPKLATEAAG